MLSQKDPPKDVDQYITGFPESTQKLLNQLRLMILKAAPGAEEVISYQMPAYKFHGMLVYFAGYDKHIGFYPTPSGMEKFKKELSVYKMAKGSVKFPTDKALPLELITRMVTFRTKENVEKEAVRMSKRK